MKKFFAFLLFALLVSQSVFAQKAWTVETIPNTRLQSNYIHVSDPDGYLSPDAEMRINTSLCAIRDTADVFIVTVNSIGDENPQDFRTKLFNYWGIGDKNKNNGMLLLFVEDKHKLEFETGYGIEPVMTDVKCFEIFNHTIKPYFKNGDYEGGLYAGVLEIVDVFGGSVPEGLVTVLPDEEVYKSAIEERDRETMSNFYLGVIALLVLIPIFSFGRYALEKKKDQSFRAKGEIKDTFEIEEKDGLKFINDPSNNWSGSAWQGHGCSKAVTFGLSVLVWFTVAAIIIRTKMPSPEQEYWANNWIGIFTLFTYFTWICFKHNRRTLKMANKLAGSSLRPKMIYEKAKNYPRTKMVNYLAYWIGWLYIRKYDKLINESIDMLCPECHQPLTKGEPVQLPDVEAAEQEQEVRVFTPMSCAAGHAFVMKEKGKRYKAYETCDVCGAHLKKHVKDTVVKNATYTSAGLENSEYECEFCHDKTVMQIEIPMLVHDTDSDSDYDSGSSSSSSSGSFGGGSSGGGGYSGSW